MGTTNLDDLAVDSLSVTGAAAVGSLTVGGAAVISEAEMEMLDGITAGTATSGKALVTDASNNLAGLGTLGCGAITSTGVVAGTGFTIGSAAINEAELETIDGVTAGTIAASKAAIASAGGVINFPTGTSLQVGAQTITSGATLALNTLRTTPTSGLPASGVGATAPSAYVQATFTNLLVQHNQLVATLRALGIAGD